jgi:hypothetical protein
MDHGVVEVEVVEVESRRFADAHAGGAGCENRGQR